MLWFPTNNANQGATFAMTEVKRYVLAVTLSTQDNVKLIQLLKSGFKRTIKCNKYTSKPELLRQNKQLNHLGEPSFKGKNGDDYTTDCLLGYTYNYYKHYTKNNYKMTAIDLSKQQALDADPKEIQQINFTANLDHAGNTRMFFILEEEKEIVFDFSQGTVKVL